jgi:integrase/recombinase XerD
MSPLRQRMIDDMTLAGLSPTTQAVYIKAVRGLAAHYRRSPNGLREEEVRAYLLALREGGAARGTFKANHYGIQFLYRDTLNRNWALFSKKRSASPSRSGSPIRSAMPKSVVSFLA